MRNSPSGGIEMTGAHDVSSPAPAQRTRRSLFGSITLWLAILITVAGAISWGYSAATRSKVEASPAGVQISSLSGSQAAPQSERARFIDENAPATVRYGASFIAAFLIAYAMKKVIRSVLLIAGLLIGAILTLKYLGLFNYDWASAQSQVEQGVEIARTEGEKYRTTIMGYLPSGLSASAGAIFGAKRG